MPGKHHLAPGLVIEQRKIVNEAPRSSSTIIGVFRTNDGSGYTQELIDKAPSLLSERHGQDQRLLLEWALILGECGHIKPLISVAGASIAQRLCYRD